MTCFYPVASTVFRTLKTANGKKAILFGNTNPHPKYKLGVDYDIVLLPCGKCIGCQLGKSREWATRCVNEASMHKQNCFITLTYDNEHLPPGDGVPTLVKKDFQDFMKRLRYYLNDVKIRFFACGEYGSDTFRPHYHAIIFGYDFPDKQLLNVKNGNYLYTSNMLANIWSQGMVSVAEVNFDTCAYVARYIMKKAHGVEAKERYQHQQPEFILCSRRPGIGKAWYELYKDDCYNYDEMVVTKKGDKKIVCKPPKYYDMLYDMEYPEKMAQIKAQRVSEAFKHLDDSWSTLRSKAREKITRQKMEKCTRSL